MSFKIKHQPTLSMTTLHLAKINIFCWFAICCSPRILASVNQQRGNWAFKYAHIKQLCVAGGLCFKGDFLGILKVRWESQVNVREKKSLRRHWWCNASTTGDYRTVRGLRLLARVAWFPGCRAFMRASTHIKQIANLSLAAKLTANTSNKTVA